MMLVRESWAKYHDDAEYERWFDKFQSIAGARGVQFDEAEVYVLMDVKDTFGAEFAINVAEGATKRFLSEQGEHNHG